MAPARRIVKAHSLRTPVELIRLKVMGVLNVTPDSFSDGGRFVRPEISVDHALEMAAQGAEIIDMGAESTRPGSRGVSAAEQLRRLLPVLRAFRTQSRTPVSIDTQSAKVAQACLDAGANIINDISAMRHDPRMAGTVSKAGCEIILMHMRGTPRTMQRNPAYKDVVAEIILFFKQRLAASDKAGIARSSILLDPGIGFGKTLAHNLEILKRLSEFKALQCPLVVGVSRKGFLGTMTNEPAAEKRVAASVAAAVWAAVQGAEILRVHDVAEHKAALRVAEVLLNS